MIRSISSPDLISGLDDNLVAFWSSYGRAEGCRLEASPDLVWFYTGVPHPICNGVVRTAGTPESVLDTHAELGRCIAAAGAPALWWVGPRSDTRLPDALAGRGLPPAGAMPGMVIDLAAIAGEPAAPSGLTIRKVDSTDLQRLWGRICALGTNFAEPAADAFAAIEARLTDPDYRAQHRYIGLLDGQPVASAALVTDGGVAGVYAIATIDGARRRGIGRYMTELVLWEGRQRGNHVGVLQASAMGRPIYERIGFRAVCTYSFHLQDSALA